MAKIEIDMTPQEIQLFRELLESVISDLQMEIADTDRLEFREKLKVKRVILQKVISRLSGAE
ncbi:MAG TPA: hypothetical protein ENI61_05930 [Ignavibacteria bacterium]|mgnify:CR=1 FL=1|nr:hypothetical protein [Ignavibacteria bacterium]